MNSLFSIFKSRFGSIARELILGLVFLFFLSTIGAITLIYLLYHLAVRPNPSQIDTINQRLDRIEKRLVL